MDLVGHNLRRRHGKHNGDPGLAMWRALTRLSNSGDYSRVVYFGHTVGGELTPTLGKRV